MSMYHLMHGENPLAVLLLACARTHREAFARFRDAFLSADGTKIRILTRTGGGNRDAYKFAWEQIRSHPNYIEDRDDDFDSTYAWITFGVDQDYLDSTKPLATGEEPASLRAMTDALLDDEARMRKLASNPHVKELATRVVRALQRGGGGVVG